MGVGTDVFNKLKLQEDAKSNIINDIDIKITGVTLRRVGIWGLSCLIFIGGFLYPYRTQIKLFFINDALELKESASAANNKSILEKLDAIIEFNNYLKPILEDMPEFKSAAERVQTKKDHRLFK